MTLPALLALFTPAGGSGGGSMAVFLVQMGLIFAIFYFLLIRPQRLQQKRHQERLTQLKRGDEIITGGGIVGEVVHLKDDRVTVKSGESRLIVDRQRIAQVIDRTEEAKQS